MNLLIYCILAMGLVFTGLVLTIFFNNTYLKKQAGLLSYRAERKQALRNANHHLAASPVIEGYNEDMAIPKIMSAAFLYNRTLNINTGNRKIKTPLYLFQHLTLHVHKKFNSTGLTYSLVRI